MNDAIYYVLYTLYMADSLIDFNSELTHLELFLSLEIIAFILRHYLHHLASFFLRFLLLTLMYFHLYAQFYGFK